MKIQKTKKVTVSLQILVIITIFAIGTIFLVWYSSFHPKDSEAPIRAVNTVDYSSPTEEELESSQDAKKRGERGNEDESDTIKQTANIGISFANVEGSNFQVRAFTPSVIEGTGTCTAILTNGFIVVSESSKAFVDATSSQCRPIEIPLSKLSISKSWKMVVKYSSDTHEGYSQEEVIEI